jgi:hypothetical protein
MREEAFEELRELRTPRARWSTMLPFGHDDPE